MSRARRGERGSITVVAAAVLALLAVFVLATADATRALLAVGRAQTAADAAALAAAQELVSPSGADPQAAASRYAEANGGRLVTCECEAGTTEATVDVAVPAGHFLLLPGPDAVTRSARAVVGGASG